MTETVRSFRPASQDERDAAKGITPEDIARQLQRELREAWELANRVGTVRRGSFGDPPETARG